ncbi:MAG: hypothetical protein ACQESR_10780 [Planctomycetota bacterium]
MNTLDFLARQYEQHHDPVMRHYFEAQQCLELQDMLQLGVLLYSSLKRHHDWWVEKVENGWEPFDESKAESFANQFANWRETTKFWLAIANRFEKKGYKVDRLNELRRHYEEIRSASLDVKGLRESFTRLDRGEGMDLDCFFDELQNTD